MGTPASHTATQSMAIGSVSGSTCNAASTPKAPLTPIANNGRKLSGWTWDARVDNWEQGFSRLQDYVEHNGHARIPQPYTVDGFPLGVWVAAQRRFRRKGALGADREQRLGDLSGWTWDARADKWGQGFSRLQEYVEHNGHSRVPVAYTIDGYPLGQWVITQRHFHSKGTLSADRQRRLRKLSGWTWDPFADQWEEGFSRLQEYVEHNGDARVPHSHKVDGFGLGQWVLGQRQKFAKGTLSADRQRRLRKLSGWTWRGR
jgi:helicase associated protein